MFAGFGDLLVYGLTILSSLAGFALACWRYVVKPMMLTIRQVLIAAEGIEQIKQELHPNAGKSLRDIVERIEDRLSMNEGLARLVLQQVTFGVFLSDAQGLYTWVNQCYLDMVGIPQLSIMGNGWINSVVPEDRERVFEEWQAAIAQHREFDLHFRVLSRVNDLLEVHTHGYPVYEYDQSIVGYVGTMVPVNRDSGGA